MGNKLEPSAELGFLTCAQSGLEHTVVRDLNLKESAQSYPLGHEGTMIGEQGVCDIELQEILVSRQVTHKSLA